MKVVFYGKLRDAYGESLSIHADSVEDAVRGLSMQLPDWPSDMLIDIPGFETVEQLSAKTDIETIYMLPSVHGGGGKVGSILLGIALIAVAFIAFPLVGPGLLTNTGILFATMGASMVLNGIVSLFMKAPSISKSNDPDASKYLGLNKNTTAVGTLIKLSYGRTDMTPHYLSIQSNSDNLVHAVWPTNPT